MDYSLKLSDSIYREIITHLIPAQIRAEEAGFCFVRRDSSTDLEFLDWYGATDSDFAYHSLYHIELTDECRGRVIKRAHDLNASIIEFHSHPYSRPAEFSPSDFAGFLEFVPHVWWRLKGGPYAAIVVAPSSFDSLVWVENPDTPSALLNIVVEQNTLRPTALSLPLAFEGGARFEKQI